MPAFSRQRSTATGSDRHAIMIHKSLQKFTVNEQDQIKRMLRGEMWATRSID